ncbi:MAG TPA: Calx-beta domain-containing protein, partial [Aquabacterium sp.]|nr:Calx-beta domain-containing protein [Aquabacterium sp.]
FAPGATTATIEIEVLNDSLYEGVENFAVLLSPVQDGSSAPVFIQNGIGLGGINDEGGPSEPPPGPNVPPEVLDDDTPTVSINDVEVNEAAGKIIFTVTLSNPSTGEISLDFATEDLAAVAGEDYVGKTGKVTFAPGQTTATIEIDVLNDAIYEGVENFAVLLSPVEGSAPVSIQNGIGLGGINDEGGPSEPPPGPNVPPGTPDDDRPAVSGISSPSATEGAPLNFTVTLSHQSTTDTTVTLKLEGISATLDTDTGAVLVSTDGGTSFNPATVNPDGTITVTVPANAPVDALRVQVPTVADAISEETETIRLSGSTDNNAAPLTGTGTINDGNGLPTLSVNDVEVNEAAGVAIFTVTLSNASSTPVTVNYATQDGT